MLQSTNRGKVGLHHSFHNGSFWKYWIIWTSMVFFQSLLKVKPIIARATEKRAQKPLNRVHVTDAPMTSVNIWRSTGYSELILRSSQTVKQEISGEDSRAMLKFWRVKLQKKWHGLDIDSKRCDESLEHGVRQSYFQDSWWVLSLW